MLVIFPKVCGYFQDICILEVLSKMVENIINDSLKAYI